MGDLVCKERLGVVCGVRVTICSIFCFLDGSSPPYHDNGQEVDLSDDPLYQQLNEEEKGLLDQVSVGNSAKLDLASKATADPALGMALWQLLEKLDPPMAARWHYRDARKVANSLRVYKETGRPHSAWIAEQDPNLPPPLPARRARRV